MLRSPARTFLVLGALFGTVFVLLTPPLQAPDEWMHFRRAYAVSEGSLRAEIRRSPVTGQDSACGEFPDRLLVAEKTALFSLPYAPDREAEILSLQGLTEDPFVAGRTFNGWRILSLAKQSADDGRRSVLCFPNTALHPPHLYFPQALGMALVSALDEDAGIRLSTRDRLKLAAITAISSLWIVTTQYLSWTEVGAGLIEGVYGRYFIPIAPLFFLPFQGLAASRGRRFPALPAAVAAYAVTLLAYAAHALTAYWGS